MVSYLLPRRAAAAAAAAAGGSVGRAWGRIPAMRRRGSPGLPSFRRRRRRAEAARGWGGAEERGERRQADTDAKLDLSGPTYAIDSNQTKRERERGS